MIVKQTKKHFAVDSFVNYVERLRQESYVYVSTLNFQNNSRYNILIACKFLGTNRKKFLKILIFIFQKIPLSYAHILCTSYLFIFNIHLRLFYA